MADPESTGFLVGCLVMFVCGTLAAAGGIGGGALNVPILLSVVGCSYKEAVVLSLCAVAGNTLSQVIVNLKKSHPLDKTRPIIYFDAGLILIPAQLGGNNIGVILAAILPTTALIMLAICVIIFAVYMTAKKGLHLYEVESAVRGHMAGSSSIVSNPAGGKYNASIIMEQGQNARDTSKSQQSGVSEVSLMIHEGLGPRSRAGSELAISDIKGSKGDEGEGETVIVLEDEETGETSIATYSHFTGSSVDHDPHLHTHHSTQKVLVEPATHQQLVIETFTDKQLTELAISRASSRAASRQGSRQGSSRQNSTYSNNGGAEVVVNIPHMLRASLADFSAGATRTSAGAVDAPNLSLINPVSESSDYDGRQHHHDSSSTKQEEVIDVTGSKSELELVYPMISVYVLFATLVYFVAVNTGMAEVGKCSTLYWCILGLSYPGLAAIVYYCIDYTSVQQEEHPESVLPGDLNYTKDKFLRPTAAFIIGIACSLLGIGGGELFGPFMLTMKILPQVSSATTSLMSFISAANNIIHHIVVNDLPYLSGVILFGVGMSAGVIGRLGALKITKLFGRPSILIFILASILFASSIIMVVEMTSEAPSFDFDSVCSK